MMDYKDVMEKLCAGGCLDAVTRMRCVLYATWASVYDLEPGTDNLDVFAIWLRAHFGLGHVAAREHCETIRRRLEGAV